MTDDMVTLYQWLIRGKDGRTSLTDYFESEDEMLRMNPTLTKHFEIVERVDATAISDPNIIKRILERRNSI